MRVLGCFWFVWMVFAPLKAVYAGAWLQNEGDGYFASNLTLFSTNRFYGLDGFKTPQSRFTKLESNIYAEYGAYPWLTIGANLFVNRATQNGTSNVGLADSELFARFRLFDLFGWHFSGQPLVKLPSVYENGNAPLAGSQSTDLEFSVLASRKHDYLITRARSDVRVGYRKRSRNLNAQLKLDWAFHVYLTKRLAIVPAYRIVLAEKINGDKPFSQDGEQDYDLYKTELGVQYDLRSGKTLLASIFHHSSGINTGAGEGVSVGLGWSF